MALYAETAITPQVDIVRVVLALDRLDEYPFFGSGCCAIAASDAIEQELLSWPFVQQASVNELNNLVTLQVDRRSADIDALVEAIESMGFDAIERR